MERSGTTDLSRHSKIFVTADTSKSCAKILSRGHISGHLKILGGFVDDIFTHKKLNEILLGFFFVQDFVPIRTALKEVKGQNVFRCEHWLLLIGRKLLMGFDQTYTPMLVA